MFAQWEADTTIAVTFLSIVRAEVETPQMQREKEE
jgi:hypothetical protein